MTESREPLAENRIEMPASTIWPLVFAVGLALLGAGLLLNPVFAVVGAALVINGGAGWFREAATPRGMTTEELVPPEQRARPIQPTPAEVERLRVGMPGHRLRLPEKIHPYSAGFKGGLVGGAAMAIVALAYGVFSGHGPWYPINLLAAMVLPAFNAPEPAVVAANLARFSLAGLVMGTLIHVLMSIGLGLIYAVLLPMAPWPRMHLLHLVNAGIVAPLLWSGALHSFMGVLNEQMSQHVNWPWFVASQIAYGLACGVVVRRTELVSVTQHPPVTSPGDAVEPDAEGQS